jgi:hypothetical protein
VSAVLLGGACEISISAARAQQSTQNSPDQVIPWTDAWVDRQYDWIFYFNLDRNDRYLKYPGSSYPGITRVFIDYRLCPRPRNKSMSLDRTKFQDLWYHDEQAVGCRRYNDIIMPNQEQGCLYIPPDPLVQSSVKSLTNAVIRTVLELYARKAIITAICVPKDQFDAFVSALGQMNFFRLDVAVPGGPGENMTLHVVTNPKGIERYFYYDDTGRRGNNPSGY